MPSTPIEPKKEEKKVENLFNVKWSAWKILLWAIGCFLLLNFFYGCGEKNKHSSQTAVAPNHYHSKPHAHKRVARKVVETPAPAPVVIVVEQQVQPQPVPVIPAQQVVTYALAPQRIYVPQAQPTVVIAAPVYPVVAWRICGGGHRGGGNRVYNTYVPRQQVIVNNGGGRGGHNFGGHGGEHRGN